MIDFSKRISDEAKQKYEKRKQGEAERTIGKVSAKDDGGNIYEKTVMLSEDLRVISFGWPVEYILDDLLKNLEKNKDAKRFVIDIGGRNHKGIPDVYILLNEFIELIGKAVILRKIIQSREKNMNYPKSLKCPNTNGGCNQDNAWRVTIHRESKRILLNCTKCNYRLNFPVDITKINELNCGPLDENGTIVIP